MPKGIPMNGYRVRKSYVTVKSGTSGCCRVSDCKSYGRSLQNLSKHLKQYHNGLSITEHSKYSPVVKERVKYNPKAEYCRVPGYCKNRGPHSYLSTHLSRQHKIKISEYRSYIKELETPVLVPSTPPIKLHQLLPSEKKNVIIKETPLSTSEEISPPKIKSATKLKHRNEITSEHSEHSKSCRPAVSTFKSSNYKDERYQNKIPISPAQTFSIPDLSKDFFENRRDLKSMPASLSSYDVFYSIIYNYEYSVSEGIAIDPSFFEKVKRNRFIQVLAKDITVDNILNIIRYRRFIMAHYRFSILSEPLGRCPICCGIGFDGKHISETVCSCIEYVTGKSLDELPQERGPCPMCCRYEYELPNPPKNLPCTCLELKKLSFPNCYAKYWTTKKVQNIEKEFFVPSFHNKYPKLTNVLPIIIPKHCKKPSHIRWLEF